MPVNRDLRFINVYGVKDGAAARPSQALEKGVTAIPS